MMQALRHAMIGYFRFAGRSSRMQFWLFAAFVFVGFVTTRLLDNILWNGGRGMGGPNLLHDIFLLLTFFPLLTVAWRRLHDTGRPGWWILLPVLTSIGSILALAGGVVGFSVLESFVADREVLRQLAAVLGAGGLVAVGVVQFIVLALLV